MNKLLIIFLILIMCSNIYSAQKSILIAIKIDNNISFIKNTGTKNKYITTNSELNHFSQKYNLIDAYKLRQRYPINNSDLFKLTFETSEKIEDIISSYRTITIVENIDNLTFDTTEDILGGILSTTPNDSLFQYQAAFDVMQIPDAWDITTGSDDVLVAILDTGLDWYHPDLIDNIYVNPGEQNQSTSIDWNNGIITGDSVNNDSSINNFVDDLVGWDFRNDDNNPIHTSGGTHGTQVVGPLGAVGDNYLHVAGTAWDVSIMGLKIDGSNYNDWVTHSIEAIDYCIVMGVDIINMSYGLSIWGNQTSFHQKIQQAYNDHNVLFVGIAHNQDNPDSTRNYPGAWPEVMAMAATMLDDKKKGNSKFGTWVEATATVEDNGWLDYVISSGAHISYIKDGATSMAAPITAGLAALIKSKYPSWENWKIRAQIRNTADFIDDVNQGYEGLLGSGRINAYKALGYVSVEEEATWTEFIHISGNAEVSTGAELTIEPNTIVEFEPGAKLTIYGKLTANSATFKNASSGNWRGIFFNNANDTSSITNCTITKADTALHLVDSDITIEDNEIYNISKYGIYSHSSSPQIETNEIYNVSSYYGIYAYNGTPQIIDNYVHDTGDYGIVVNGSGSNTYIRKNSVIDCEGGIKLYGQNDVKLRGGGGESYGLNKVEDYDYGSGTYGVKITGGTPDLGEYRPSSHRGRNNFIHEGRDIVYNSTGEEVAAEKNWWGSSSPSSSWFTGEVSYEPYLSTAVSNAGSSLDKVGEIAADKLLLYAGNELLDAKEYSNASSTFKQLIEEFPDSRYGGIALARAMSAHREAGNLESQRSFLQIMTKHRNPKVSYRA